MLNPLKLDTDTQVFFYEQDHYYLSNFSAFRLRWNRVGTEIDFDTSEHAYQFMKFYGGSEDTSASRAGVRYDILHTRSAHDAFKLAESYKSLVSSTWPGLRVQVMRQILIAKAGQHEYVRRKLIETGERELIENSWRDDFWGWGPNRDGQNMLGKLWMEVRAELRAAETAA